MQCFFDASPVLAPSCDALVPSSFLLLVVRPGAPSSVLAPSSGALVPSSVLAPARSTASGYMTLLQLHFFQHPTRSQLAPQNIMASLGPMTSCGASTQELLDSNSQNDMAIIYDAIRLWHSSTESMLVLR